ncbi:MAG TPA: XrtN system VIT domain-containing protein [Chryseolinea sp.]|nr:XrtN system VIT domain-containing protein [Chryseolinea sp.]
MESNLTSPSRQDYQNSSPKVPIVTMGYALLLISFIGYLSTEYFGEKKDMFMIFWVHYILAMAYTVALLFVRVIGIQKSWNKENINKTVIALNLFLISAYALNREIPVFENSSDWLCVYLMLSSLTILSYRYFTKLPGWVNNLQFVLLGFATALYVYLALYAANFYFFGAFGIIAFGIGAHILVPLFLTIACVSLFIKNYNGLGSSLWFGAGIGLSLSVVIFFVTEWNSRISKMETWANQSVIYGPAELPVWVSLGKYVKNDWISERILKSDLVYTTASESFREWDFMPKMVSWDEVRKHDPLVYIASLFSKCHIGDEDKVQILKAIANGRHQSNERLWSGDNLTTSYIVSDVDIYTDLRIAYTEQYLNVRNNSFKGGWQGNREEAIYTFYLPEGSVVTSLSLWINGNEEKGILTSKQKATNAYKTIVGVEQRDPSVIHWQEGNTVTVRVFPCTTDEERKFKIGITSPLKEEDGEIIYRNIIFDGPSADDARETRRISFIGKSQNIAIGSDFKRDKNGDYITEKKYNPDFQLAFGAEPFVSNNFTFDGFTYSLKPYIPNNQSVTWNEIFLDINSSWTHDELNELQELLKKYTVYAFSDERRVKLDNENWDDITDELLKQNFSLFPFHRIKDPAHALIVTKGNVLSPHLSDFSDSKFAENINSFFAKGTRVNVFSLQGASSTYINSFKELRGLEFANGTSSELLMMISENTFPKSDESEERIIIQDSKLLITKTKSDSTTPVNNAPDHLARLFAYNNIMRKAGANYFSHDFINQDLVDEAAKAYVVSPVSSLIALETKEDYKRFDIYDTENSLHNAAKQSSGAVPEPHEWALIILFVLFILYLKFRH